MNKKDNFKLIITKLEELHKKHPRYSFGSIISIAFSDYGDIWGVSDKESIFALEKYEAELELDEEDKIASPEYLSSLYKDIENFDNILDEEEDADDPE